MSARLSEAAPIAKTALRRIAGERIVLRLERELRAAMERCGDKDLPLSPESRPCRRPTARELTDLFEDVQRHTLTSPAGPPVEFTTELAGLQRKVLRLMGMSDAYDS